MCRREQWCHSPRCMSLLPCLHAVAPWMHRHELASPYTSTCSARTRVFLGWSQSSALPSQCPARTSSRCLCLLLRRAAPKMAEWPRRPMSHHRARAHQPHYAGDSRPRHAVSHHNARARPPHCSTTSSRLHVQKPCHPRAFRRVLPPREHHGIVVG